MFFVFITQSYFKVPKDVRLNTTHFFIAKIPNRRELKQIAIHHSSEICSEWHKHSNCSDWLHRQFWNDDEKFNDGGH